MIRRMGEVDHRENEADRAECHCITEKKLWLNSQTHLMFQKGRKSWKRDRMLIQGFPSITIRQQLLENPQVSAMPL